MADLEISSGENAKQRPGTEWPVPWVAIGWFAALLLICYLPVLKRLANDWYIDEDMGHGFFVPAVAAYIVWQRRNEILSKSYESNWLGLIPLILGALLLAFGTFGVELFVTRVAFVLSLTGVVFTLGGWGLIKELYFPLILLLFMIPLPSVIYYQITFPLQLLASQIAEHSIELAGIPILREGNVLRLPSGDLSVVEACSGIRSLMSLSFLSLVYGFFFDEKPWMRWVLLGCTIPIAIFANAMRVTLTGLLSEVNPELAKGLFHSLEGWVIFMVALVLLVATHQLINAVYRRSRAQQ
ncbi:MAG: exosortase [Acidobacteria bacterium]|nr:exosortase [Acidobacteriota bacterium]